MFLFWAVCLVVHHCRMCLKEDPTYLVNSTDIFFLDRTEVMLSHLVLACSLDHTWDLISKAFGFTWIWPFLLILWVCYGIMCDSFRICAEIIMTVMYHLLICRESVLQGLELHYWPHCSGNILKTDSCEVLVQNWNAVDQKFKMLVRKLSEIDKGIPFNNSFSW